MRRLLDREECYVRAFEDIPFAYRANLYHPEVDKKRVQDIASYEFCDIHYTLLPLEGRHTQALYAVDLILTAEPTNTADEVGDTVSTAVLDLETLDRGEHIKVRGWADDGETLLVRHLHFSSDWDGHDAAEYEYLTVKIEYFERTRGGSDAEIIEKKRQQFQGRIDDKNDKIAGSTTLSIDDTAF